MSKDLEVKHYKVLSLSPNLDKNAVYYLFDQSTGKVKTYITTNTGIPIPLIDLTSVGSVLSVTGTAVTGTASNPKVDIATFISSQLGNQVYLSLNDGKLQVNPITSPDNSIEVISTSSELQIQLSAAIQTRINTALQPGANISELTNNAGYLTIADIDATDLSYTPSTTNGVINSSTGTDATIPLAGALNAGLLSPSEKADIASAIQPSDLATVATTGEYSDLLNSPQTKVEFNTELTDGNFLFVGDITQYTDELAQDAIGGILTDTNTIDFTYNDGSNIISADVKQNSIDASHLADNINISEFVNDEGFESAVQLDVRDINNRNRANHTGTQLSSTIVDFDIAATAAVVENSITDGVTNKAPSENAVFDALALKADLTYVNSQDASTLASANAYSDSLVVGLWDDRGSYDASTNLYPSTGGSGTSGTVLKGDIWTVTVEGTIDGYLIKPRQTLRALSDAPGQTGSNWAIGLADPNISDAIVDGVLSVAPSQNAVYDALDLKTTLSAGAFSGFAVTNNGDGTISVGSGIAYLRATNDQYAPLIKYPIAAYNNIPLVDNLNNYIVVSYNGGSPALVLNTTGTGIDTQTNSIAIAAARVGTTVHYVSLVGSNSDPNAKLRNRYLLSEGIRRVAGLAFSATGRKIATTAGITFSGLIRLDVAAMDTNVSDTYTLAYNNGSTWTRVSGQTDINNTQYNNSGTLTTLNNNNFRTDYIYALVNSPSKLYVILGDNQYNSLSAARLAPTPSSLPVELQQLGVLIGRAIIEKNTTTMEVSSPFTQDFAAGAIENHNDLAGLQGGTAGEYNHLTNAQVSLVNGSEQTANKSATLTASSTLYPNNNAVIAGLAAKQNTISGITNNVFPKSNGSGGFVNSNLSDNGVLVTSTTDMSINGVLVGKGGGGVASNTRVGMGALSSNSSGSSNTAVGTNALQNNTTGLALTALGNNALQASSTTSSNSGFGYLAFTFLTTGDNNTANGSFAGRLDASASNLTSLSNSVLLGSQAYPLLNGDINEIVIGYQGRGLGSNTSVFGNSSTTYGRWWGNFLVGISINNGNIARFAGKVDMDDLQLNNTPATASGTPPVLTWNSSTKAVESVPYASFVTPQIKITTTTSITTATNGTVSGLGQKGRNVVIDNSTNAINLTVDGSDGFCASYLKHGTGNITFVQGSGRTLIQVDGTAVLSGAVGSTATISSVGTTDYLRISNA